MEYAPTQYNVSLNEDAVVEVKPANKKQKLKTNNMIKEYGGKEKYPTKAAMKKHESKEGMKKEKSEKMVKKTAVKIVKKKK